MPTIQTFFFPWIEVANLLYKPLLKRTNVPAHKIFWPLVAVVVAAWFITVPIHELLHVAGCLISGGEVMELTIQPMYGGILLSKVFGFITSGGDYAGQLKDFDTGGSDICYFITVSFPFLLTVFLGVPLLSIAARSGSPLWHGVGAVHTILPVASITGDYYEMGSIAATRLFGYAHTSEEAALIRGDDLFRVISRVREAELANGVLVITVGLILGIFLVALTFDLSILFTRLVARIRLEKQMIAL